MPWLSKMFCASTKQLFPDITDILFKEKTLIWLLQDELNVVMTSVTWNRGVLAGAQVRLEFLCREFLFCPAVSKCTSDSAALLYSGTNESCQPLFQYLQVIASYLDKSLRVIKKLPISEREFCSAVSFLGF